MSAIIIVFLFLYVFLKIKNDRDIKKAIKDGNIENVSCPCCGYYCSGHGGIGCINKPKLFKQQQK